MSTIVLATANARYSHTSIALRYLLENLGDLANVAELMEFTIDQRPAEIAEKILQTGASIIGLGVYVWNLELITEVVSILKRVRPDVSVVVGGPEVSFVEDFPTVVDMADYCVIGEGEVVFSELCSRLIDGQSPEQKVLGGPPVDLGAIKMPYGRYTEDDIAHRVLYVEATRGCQFGCEFCLSSRDNKIRKFELTKFLVEIDKLIVKGARRFKFVDRTLHIGIAMELLDFFIAHQDQGIFVHFELVPDRLNDELFEKLKRFKKGTLQLEVGIQSFNPDVTRAIKRKQDPDRAEAVLRVLVNDTAAHIHSDLVVGLPGETVESLAEGFDRLLAIGPDEIQVGILKRLRGAPIKRHDDEWSMVYSKKPPYEILQNKTINFETMQRLKRFARYFDMIKNSGNFATTSRMILAQPSGFESFLEFADWLYNETGRTGAIALNRLAKLVFAFLTGIRGLEKERVANHLFQDFTALGRRSFPGEVRVYVTTRSSNSDNPESSEAPPRQKRHGAYNPS